MNWITKLVKKNFSSSKNKGYDKIPEDMWLKCPSCSTLIFKEDLSKNSYICFSCDFYFKMPVKKRLEHIFNNGEYKLLDLPKVVEDPIKFKGKAKYSEKLVEYRNKTALQDAALAAYGKIGDSYCVCFVLNFDFFGGSMGVFVGEVFVNAVKFALTHKAPLLAITASGGARMQEGMFSLMQMAKTVVALEQLQEAGLPYVVLLTNPTTGGVTASFAMLGDVQLAEHGATIGFAGARVIEQTIRKKLPDGFQTADYLLKTGMIDGVVAREDIPAKLKSLFSLLLNK